MQSDNFNHTEINFEFILKSIPGYVYWKDKNFKYMFCNTPIADFFGFSSPREIIGKTDYDFGWDSLLVDEYRKIDEEIIKTGQPKLGFEEVIYTNKGEPLCLLVNKMPLFNNTGDVIGIVGISHDITAQKEAERLQKEAERLNHESEIKMQQLIVEEKEKLITLAHKVVHDISSPLSALGMIIPSCTELPEKKRIVIKRVAESIFDIANNLLSTYRNEEGAASGVEQRQPLLISDLIQQLLSEKKAQFSNQTVQFETDITDKAQFAFALMQPSQFRRSMSNLKC